jgi:hypothetical protein
MSGVLLDDLQNIDYLANTSVTFVIDLFSSDMVIYK